MSYTDINKVNRKNKGEGKIAVESPLINVAGQGNLKITFHKPS